ncbi:MAG: hypothetical protein R2778_15595 [Saprospiraceae bacterium]
MRLIFTRQTSFIREDPDGENNYFQLFASENSVRSIHKLPSSTIRSSLMFENRDFLPNDQIKRLGR